MFKSVFRDFSNFFVNFVMFHIVSVMTWSTLRIFHFSTFVFCKN